MWSQTNSFFNRSKNRVDYSFSIVNQGYLSIFIKQSQNKGLFFFFVQKQVLFRKNKYTDLLLLYHLHFLIQKYVFFLRSSYKKATLPIHLFFFQKQDNKTKSFSRQKVVCLCRRQSPLDYGAKMFLAGKSDGVKRMIVIVELWRDLAWFRCYSVLSFFPLSFFFFLPFYHLRYFGFHRDWG